MPKKISKKKKSVKVKERKKKNTQKNNRTIGKTETTKIKEKSKKVLRSLTPKESAVFIAEALASFIALVMIFVFLFSGNLFRKSPPLKQNIVKQKTESPIIQVQNNNININKQEQQDEDAAAQKIDSSDWATYSNKWYGFELKYPSDWDKVVAKKATRGVKWEHRYQFRKKKSAENNLYSGFDVTVYNVNKVKQSENTEEFPALKEGVDPNTNSCSTIEGHLKENPNYPAEEIYIPLEDECYNSSLFYSLTKDSYTYNINIAPANTEGLEKTKDPKQQALENFPEFFAAAASFNLIDTVRPRPQIKPVTPRITAPQPTTKKQNEAPKRISGIRCPEKIQHPHESVTRGRHVDEDCCPDPDEWPKSGCAYSAHDYGIMLKGKPK